MKSKQMKTKKNLLMLLVLSAFLILGTGCAVQRSQPTSSRGLFFFSKPGGKVPPGQMKKMTGAKSAKAYAPGQNKKYKKHKKR